MIPVLYSSDSEEFESNGTGMLVDTISCLVTEERNGVYELELTYPISGIHSESLVPEGIIKATAHRGDGGQLFDIYKIEKDIEGNISISARHISGRLSMIPCSPFAASTVTEAFTKLARAMVYDEDFTFHTDKTTSAVFELLKPNSTKSVLGGDSGSFLDVYGGEFEFDNFDVYLHSSRGQDSGVVLRYGKNISAINQEVDFDNVYTGIYPYFADNENYVEIDGKVKFINNYQNYPRKRIAVVDLSSYFQGQSDGEGGTENIVPTEEELEDAADLYMEENEFGKPIVNVNVSFEPMTSFAEYEGLAELEEVQLCDTVSVYFPTLDISVKSKVIKTVYNTLLDRYDSVEIGEVKSNFTDSVYQMSRSNQNETRVTKTYLETAQSEATKVLLGANGGYKVEKTNSDGQIIETLYMDSLDESTATKVWRWNINGLGYSPNGPSGPYTVAITKNGEIVADFITTGTLRSIVIEAGDNGQGQPLFQVDANGNIYAAGSGNIGGCTLSNGHLTVADDNISGVSADKLGTGSSGTAGISSAVLQNSRDSLQAAIGTLNTLNVRTIKVGAGVVFERDPVSGNATFEGLVPSWTTINNLTDIIGLTVLTGTPNSPTPNS